MKIFVIGDPHFKSKNALETNEMSNRIYEEVIKEKPGLWANIRAQRARGEKPSHPNSKAYKDAVKAGKEILKKEKK